jgi:hypothetical protein
VADEQHEMNWQDYQPTPDYGPPIDVLPGCMNSLRLLALTDDVAIAIGGFRVWDVGFLFTLSVRLSPNGMANLHNITFDRFRPGEPSVLLEMRWPNGTRVSNTKLQRPGGRHTFAIGSGHGSGPCHDFDWWVSPLPHPPAITLACTWPQAKISNATIEVPEQELREAASRQVRLWTQA